MCSCLRLDRLVVHCRGYAEYDVVAQFDCDHIPGPTYLSSCLPAFLDPSIGYVACPSVNTLGCSNSWAARGRLYYEAVFNRAGQAAWFPDFMPVCIGSHYVVRTAHLKAVSACHLRTVYLHTMPHDLLFSQQCRAFACASYKSMLSSASHGLLHRLIVPAHVLHIHTGYNHVYGNFMNTGHLLGVSHIIA